MYLHSNATSYLTAGVQATLMDSVVVLPANPLVSRVACTVDTLTVAVVDAAASESWLPGVTIMASAAAPWLCPDTRDDEAKPFTRIIMTVQEVRVAPLVTGSASFHYDDATDFSEGGYTYAPSFAGRAATFVFRTAPVPAHAAFKHLDFSYVRTPPRALELFANMQAENATFADELRAALDDMLRDADAFSSNGTVPLHVALARRLGISDDHARRLWWNPISALGSAVTYVGGAVVSAGSAVGSAVVNAGTAVVSIASALARDGRWELSGASLGLREYTFLDWRESTDYYNRGGARVWCNNCRAYLGGGFTAIAKFKYGTLQSAELSVHGSAQFTFGIRGTYSQACLTVSKEWPTDWRKVTSFTVPVLGVPVRFSVSARFVPEISLSGTGTASFATPSIDLRASVKMGVEYVSGWRAINDFSNTRSLTPASWRVAGGLQVTITPHIDVSLSIYDAWEHELRLSPSLIFRAITQVPSTCLIGLRSDSSNVAK